jgi:hypothetical protein
VKDTSFSFSLDASDGEFRGFTDQNSSSKPRARQSLLKKLNLAVSDLTPRKRKLGTIWRIRSTLCKLRKKYRSRKLKDLCVVYIYIYIYVYWICYSAVNMFIIIKYV